MDYRKLELNIISAKDLKDVNLFSKMDVYAVVSVSGDPLHPQTATTHVHKDSGTSPTWNFPVKFVVNETLAQQNRLSLEVKLLSDRTLAGDTVIGTVHIPMKELLDNPGGGGGDSFRQVSYQVKRSSGKAKGTFNFSYKFGEKVDAPATKAGKTHEPVMAYPPPVAGSSSVPYGTPQAPGYGYPPPAYGAQPGHGYPPQQPGYGYPPQQPGYGYPPQQPGYGYPPQQPGYGYPPQQAGYGYPPQQAGQKPKKNKLGMGLGAGLLGGALGGMILGDMVSDAGDYDGGFDDGGGFDF